MGLSVYTYYETFKPHFSFRFKVDFLANPSLYRLVQDIKLPTISINASDGRKRFGQTQFVLPFFEFGDQEIEITFVETDTMKVLDYLTNNYNWPNLPNTEDIIVTEYDDTLRNIIKRTKYTITLFSYSAPQWQNSGSPSNMTITATYIVRSSRDITKDEYDLYNLPIYSPVVDMVQDMNVIGSSVDEGSAESEWQKFLGSLKDEETELEKNAELNRQRQEAMMQPMAFDTNTKAKEKWKDVEKEKGELDESIAKTLEENFYNSSSEDQQAAEIEAFKRYCNSEMNAENRDFSMMTDEEKKIMAERWQKLSDTEKLLMIYGIDTADGLSDDEINTIKNAAAENALNQGLTGKEAEDYMKESLDSIVKENTEFVNASKEYQDAVNHPEQGRGGEKRTGSAPCGMPAKMYSTMTDAEQKAYLREMLKNEISGKATNGHSRKEGNDNQVYKNSSDDKKANPTQMNYGYGNTYATLKSLGADKLGEVTFKASKDVTIDGKTYKKGETIKFTNLTAANEALKDETLGSNGLVLDQASADKLNNLVLDKLAGEMQKKFKEKGIEDVIDNMNMNAQMGLTHMVYGGSGTLNSVTEGLAKNKQEAIDSLQANGGYLGADYVEKHKNDKGSTYKSTNDKTQVTMSWNRLDYMSEQGKTIKKTDKNGKDISTPASKKQSQNQQVAKNDKTNEKPLQKYTSSNSNRDADLAELRSKMQAAGVDTTNTSQVVDYLVKDGTITSSYKKDQNGLCATGTNLVAAVTSGATHMESTGNGKDQNLSCYGYKKVASGKGADQLNDMLKHGQLKEGDVINISYSDGSKYGHAVTVYKDNKGQLAFASDYVQKSSHGQSNASRVGEFYIQRKA